MQKKTNMFYNVFTFITFQASLDDKQYDRKPKFTGIIMLTFVLECVFYEKSIWSFFSNLLYLS